MGIQFGYFTNEYDKLSLRLQGKHLTVLVTREPMTVFQQEVDFGKLVSATVILKVSQWLQAFSDV